jgi:hypothetical protein
VATIESANAQTIIFIKAVPRSLAIGGEGNAPPASPNWPKFQTLRPVAPLTASIKRIISLRPLADVTYLTRGRARLADNGAYGAV